MVRRRRRKDKTETTPDAAGVAVLDIPPGHKKPPYPATPYSKKRKRHFECENACLFLISSVGGWQLSQMLVKTTGTLARLNAKPDPEKACQLEPVPAVNGSLDDITAALNAATSDELNGVLMVDATIRRILGK